MPYSIPSLSDIASTLLRDIRNQLPDADTGPDSDYAIRANSIASAVSGLYQYQSWIVRQIFPDTADHDYLVMHCRVRNITPKQATPAGGSVIFTGTAGTPLPQGLQFRPTGSSQLYQTTVAATVGPGGSVTVAAASTTPGSASNVPDNTSATLMTTPSGVDGTVTITKMSGGTDDETDASLLARLLEVIRRPPAGGNKYDYHMWAMSVSGVTQAYVYPLRRGYGTVDVVIIANNDLPSAATLQAVQAYIDDQRPVTAKDTLILAPTEIETDVTIHVSLSELSLDDARAQIIGAITDYFNRLAPGEIAVRTQIGALVSDISGVIDYVIVTPTQNITPTVDQNTVQWVRPGVITVGLLS
ncbi:baseplate J/gp47 family protein [Serratia marcescens]|uniref:Baseplate J/gp47 family protein n=1 Tax=Serratia marcescens TaxID=615 RepID=A0A5C7BX33_SERMA|nr:MULTISPECIES: baseplate J/gp47 family protein [Serratia]TXE27156.1 baseplate J/gp47 family protein [Serratia marcescens]TXE55287.1 baseplate J/gp47 family protein [Serratia marcescens]